MSQNLAVIKEIEHRVIEVISPGPQGPAGSASSGVSKIIAGTNVSISPTGGTGDVTINSASSGSGTVTSVTGGTALTVVGTNPTVSPTINHDNFGTAQTTTLIQSVQTNAQGHVIAMSGANDAAAFRGNIGLKSTAVTDMGTAANNVVQLDGSQRLPAVNGSQLTNLTASEITSGTLAIARGGTGSATAPMIGVVTAADAAAARTVLALGTVATTASTAYATAAQGGKADSALQDVVSDTSPQLGGNLDVQSSTLTTSTTNGNIVIDPPGTGFLQVEGTTNPGKIRLMCEQGSHGVGLVSPAHTVQADYDLTLPTATGAANQALKTDGSGQLGWSTLGTAAAAATGDFAAASHTHTVSQISDLSDPVTSPAMTGVSAGSITGVIKCSQSQYDAITPNANTLYVIV